MTCFDHRATLAALEQRLRTASDLMDIWTEFQAHVAAAPRFMRLGRLARNPRLESIIDAAAERLTRRRLPITGLVLLHLDDEGFWHGACRVGRLYVMLFYFDRIDMGLFGFKEGLDAEDIHLARITTLDRAAGGAAAAAIGLRGCFGAGAPPESLPS